jgi:hypothetical protein
MRVEENRRRLIIASDQLTTIMATEDAQKGLGWEDLVVKYKIDDGHAKALVWGRR